MDEYIVKLRPGKLFQQKGQAAKLRPEHYIAAEQKLGLTRYLARMAAGPL